MAKDREVLEKAVTRGAQWFDLGIPDWYRRVNRETLDMGQGSSCLFAQVLGVETWVGKVAGLTIGQSGPQLVQDAENLGFAVFNGWGGFDPEDVAALNELWKAAIEKRLNASAA